MSQFMCSLYVMFPVLRYSLAADSVPCAHGVPCAAPQPGSSRCSSRCTVCCAMGFEEQRHFQPWRDYMGLADTVRAMQSSHHSEPSGPEVQQEFGFIAPHLIFPEPEMSELGDLPRTRKGRLKRGRTGTVGSPTTTWASLRPEKKLCGFCKNNGKSEYVFTSYYVKDRRGEVLCPYLHLQNQHFIIVNIHYGFEEGWMHVATSQYGEDQNGDDLKPLEVFHGTRVPSRGVSATMIRLSVGVMRRKTLFRALAFDASGTKLATASEKGTIIPVFSIPEGQKLLEFRRGVKRCENATAASYEVAQLIAQHGKPFSDGDFIKQCLIKVTEVMCPEKVQDFNNVSLSRNTVVRRIEDLSANLKLQLREKACAFDFYSIACDESTDATDTAQLLIFLRGVDDNFCCTEELLDMMSLKGTTTGGNIFDAVSEAIEKIGLKWDKLCGVTTDGAPAMTGERKGMASMVCVKVKESGGEAVRMHCIIHQEALCAKTVQLGDVMNTVVKTVNIIRARGLYHREFQAFLSDVDAEYGDVLYHSDVRWLSRGSLLQRFYSLRSEIDKFLKEKGRPLHKLSDPLWLADLAFLVDLTHHLNTLNKNLQGKEQLVSHLYAHMKAFCVKLRLFETQLRSFNAAHFPALSEIKSAFPKADLSAKKEKYASVITSLVTEFNQRFQDFSVIEKQIKLFSTPFLVDAEEVEESLQLELIEMQCDDSLKSQHQLLSLPDFYQSLDHAKFPLMRRHAKRMMS
ncbi:hypothetical protein QTP86_003004, partial [Hemibagrus guttatus]